MRKNKTCFAPCTTTLFDSYVTSNIYFAGQLEVGRHRYFKSDNRTVVAVAYGSKHTAYVYVVVTEKNRTLKNRTYKYRTLKTAP